MFKGAIRPAYSYEHYLSQRAYNTKILKKDCYALLDNPDKIIKHIEAYNQRHAEAIEYMDKEFGL